MEGTSDENKDGEWEGEMDVIDVEKMEVFEAVRILGYLHVFANIWLSRVVQRS
jgi:hypothetical protein